MGKVYCVPRIPPDADFHAVTYTIVHRLASELLANLETAQYISDTMGCTPLLVIIAIILGLLDISVLDVLPLPLQSSLAAISHRELFHCTYAAVDVVPDAVRAGIECPVVLRQCAARGSRR